MQALSLRQEWTVYEQHLTRECLQYANLFRLEIAQCSYPTRLRAGDSFEEQKE